MGRNRIKTVDVDPLHLYNPASAKFLTTEYIVGINLGVRDQGHEIGHQGPGRLVNSSLIVLDAD
jgi:hypothetical protein